MSSTATNKQPLLVDRPLFDSVRVTTQTVGSASSNTLFVQGGQGPSILVDMDASLSEDTNMVVLLIPLRLCVMISIVLQTTLTRELQVLVKLFPL